MELFLGNGYQNVNGYRIPNLGFYRVFRSSYETTLANAIICNAKTKQKIPRV